MDRIVAWYRLGSSVGAVVALIVANAIPLIGVLAFGWSVWNILVIYWLENGIVGVINVLKMSTATGDGAAPGMTVMVNGKPASSMTKAGLIPFFIVHYGIFWFVHGIFVLTLPAFFSLASDSGMTLDLGPVLFAAAALAISHGLSFWWNFLHGGEYRRTTVAGLMFAPYRRLVALHLTIIFGAMAVMFSGAPAAAVAVLVAIKTVIDLALHLAEHRGELTPRGVVTN
ncbi:MAG TPA: DUF6498-containing protein [Candidatus Limnocylindrales bacterium]|nr:DUF6498-containing protein [Candidatus Limnocylindrales bacterium]